MLQAVSLTKTYQEGPPALDRLDLADRMIAGRSFRLDSETGVGKVSMTSPPIAHTQLELVAKAFIVSYLGLLLILVVYTGLCALWRHIANRERCHKSRTDRDRRDPDFFD